MFKRGDRVAYMWTPEHLTPNQDGTRSSCFGQREEVKAVYRQRKTVLLSLWNGKVCVPVSEQYDDVEVPWSEVKLTERLPGSKHRRPCQRRRT